MKYTNQFRLLKPDESDFYDIENFNENADKIEEALKTMKNELNGAAQEATLQKVCNAIGDKHDGNISGDVPEPENFYDIFNWSLAKKINYFSMIYSVDRAMRIDTSISSRASADTALNNTIWTDKRAAEIDEINTAVGNMHDGYVPGSPVIQNFDDVFNWPVAKKLNYLMTCYTPSRAKALDRLSSYATTLQSLEQASLDRDEEALEQKILLLNMELGMK